MKIYNTSFDIHKKTSAVDHTYLLEYKVRGKSLYNLWKILFKDCLQDSIY